MRRNDREEGKRMVGRGRKENKVLEN